MDNGTTKAHANLRKFRRICGQSAVIAALCANLALSASAVTAERSLAGIKIFSPMSIVLRTYGTPSEVRIGGQTTGSNTAQPVQAFGTSPYGGAGYRGPGYAPGAAAQGTDYGAASPVLGDGNTQMSGNSVTWIYDENDGGSLEFTFSPDGRVIVIHATGVHGPSRTLKGVALGMKMSDVLSRYGVPEDQSIQGKILFVDYSESYHTAFQFFHGKLVGIRITAVD